MPDDRLTQFLIRQIAEAEVKAKTIVQTASMAGRPVDEAEEQQINALVEEGLKLKKQLESDQRNAAFEKSIADLAVAGPADPTYGRGTVNTPVSPQDSFGAMFVKSGVYKAIKEAKVQGRLPQTFKSEGVSLPWPSGRGQKTSPLLESNTTDIFDTFGTDLPGVYTPGLFQMRPTIADIIPVVPITVGNTARWRVAAVRGQLALSDVPVEEGTTKPTLAWDFTLDSAELIKLAAITKVSEEYLEDDVAIAAFLNADMPFQIRYVEETYLADALYDSVADATPLSSGTNGWDEILAAMVEIQDAGGSPDAFLITPVNYAELLATKNTGGDEGYVGGGPFVSTGNPWGGLRPIITRAAVDDHPLVGDFGMGARLFRKGALRVDSTNSNDDDFENNLITIRAEMREVVAKVYPEFFVTADLS